MEKDKIEVGEYIRTKDNTIDRIADIRLCVSGRTLISFEKSNACRSDIGIEKYILKHSKNIIDLIEVGDFVGKCEIEYITKNENGETLLMNDNVTLTEKDIHSIVTKEQYKEMEYRV